MFHVVATILVMLSITIAMNGFFSADQVEGARMTLSSALSGLFVPGVDAQGTLFDTYSYAHSQYIGLRF